MPACENTSSCVPQQEAAAEHTPLVGKDFEDIRIALLSDVDVRMNAKVEELWLKGKQMMTQVQKKHQEKQERLSGEVKQCLERQHALEVENERMKQALSRLVVQLSHVGGGATIPGLPAGPPGIATTISNCGDSSATTAAGSVTASPNLSWSTPPHESQSTPLRTDTAANGIDHFPVLPEIPKFPFPCDGAAATPLRVPAPPGIVDPAATRLSLAEAIGTQSAVQPQATPKALSLADSLPSPSGGLEAIMQQGGGSFTFTFTLRKADDTDLGLNVSHCETDKVLLVEGVRAEGAVEAWNRLCTASHPEKSVIPGDKIIGVNQITYDPDRMLEECKLKQLLRLTVVRGALPSHAGSGGANGVVSNNALQNGSGGSLRAEATEFVPIGATGIAAGVSTGETPATVDE